MPDVRRRTLARSRLLFAGTPAFALASLRALVESGIRPHAVLTQPDRRAGRGRRLAPGPVKQYAVGHGIDVLQPASLRDPDAVAQIAYYRPDLLIVAAYGLLLPQTVLDLPRSGCLNVHASLLPRWRGAAPIQAAILAGDLETGISLMQMDAGLDTGPVHARAALPIGADATAGDVHDALAPLGGRLLVENLEAILGGQSEAVPQDDSEATYAPKISKEDARLDWNGRADDLARSVRAYNPVPGARFALGEEIVKCWRAVAENHAGAPPGTVLDAGTGGILVACGSGALRLTELQRPGRRPLPAARIAEQVDLLGRRLG